MKVVKNVCYGGFGLSPLATKEYMKLKGKKCYFFETDFETEKYKKLTLKEATEKGLFWTSYTVPNPDDYRLNERDKDGFFKEANKRAEKISTDIESRHDPDLIKVVEKLGEEANGSCAKLEIVNIPDDVDYEISEYDGIETIEETHMSW